jgi:hypothetical protein
VKWRKQVKAKLTLAACFVVFASVTAVRAQDKTDVRILDAKTIEIKTDSLKPLPRPFVIASNDPATYSLYEIESPDPEVPCVYERCINPWPHFLDDKKPPECQDTNCQLITLHLTKALPSKGSFLLLITGLQAVGKRAKVPFKADPTAEIVGPWDAYRNRREFRIRSNVPVQAAATIKVARTVTRLTPDSMNAVEKPEDMTATLVQPSPTPTPQPGATPEPKLIHSFRFAKKLLEGNEYDLAIAKGIKDPAGQDLLAKGKVKIPGAPAPPEDPKISLTLSSLSAVKQKSVFEFGFNYAPLHNVKAFEWGEMPIYFEPSVVADLSLRSTKSNNSITFYLPLTMKFELGAPYRCKSDPHKPDSCKDFKNSNIPIFASWARTPWTRFAATKFYVGPKLEFDRTFQRRNVLGSLRFDFLLYRWMGSISHKRGLITAKLPLGIGEDKAATLEGINTGLKITPYFSFDFGGHVNNETVKKEVAAGQVLSLVVPRHKILRSYLGFTGTVEWRLLSLPMTLTLDESVVYIGARETIGFTTDTGIGSRQLRGFHPHFKTQWDIAFDPAQHYSFNVTFENGRLAPNFEYLNKLAAGVKVRY